MRHKNDIKNHLILKLLGNHKKTQKKCDNRIFPKTSKIPPEFAKFFKKHKKSYGFSKNLNNLKDGAKFAKKH